MDRITKPRTAAPHRPLASSATVVADAIEGEPAEFTLDGGDGTVVRGPWDTSTPPQSGDAALVIRTDDGVTATYWLIARSAP